MELSIHNTQTITITTKSSTTTGVDWVEFKITDDLGNTLEIAAFGKPKVILGENDD